MLISINSIIYNDLELKDPLEIANAFNTHFANIGKSLAFEIENTITNDANYMQYLNTPSLKTCKFKCVSPAIDAIDDIENKNSSGHDGISNKTLKFIKFQISKPLNKINQMITTGNFPESFKKSKIVSLFNKGAPSLLTNYRPISLLPTISKIFEKIIHDRMYEYLNDNNLLAEKQFGFCKLHSTEYAAVKLIDHVAKQMESGHISLVICILIFLKRLILYLTIYCYIS